MLRLDAFLNVFENAGLALDSLYDSTTEAAVRDYQVKYNDEILKPWVDAGHLPTDTTSTGYVYRTTERHINMRVCPEEFLPIPTGLHPDINVYNHVID